MSQRIWWNVGKSASWFIYRPPYNLQTFHKAISKNPSGNGPDFFLIATNFEMTRSSGKPSGNVRFRHYVNREEPEFESRMSISAIVDLPEDKAARHTCLKISFFFNTCTGSWMIIIHSTILRIKNSFHRDTKAKIRA